MARLHYLYQLYVYNLIVLHVHHSVAPIFCRMPYNTRVLVLYTRQGQKM